MMNLKQYLDGKQALVEKKMEAWLPNVAGNRLSEAMRYSLMAGGKRIRPVLALASCEACGGNVNLAMPVACTLEMIHTYSLIHDDLPAMDNDDLRRGMPTSHKKFDEATAILAGDALLTEAFRLLAQRGRESGIPPTTLVEIIEEMAFASGLSGMAGGQMLDLQFEGKETSPEELENIHAHKTGRLLQVSVIAGAKAGGGTPAQIEALSRYGGAIGLAFQIADDILDVEGGSAEMGKNTHKDADHKKATYPGILGLEASKKRAKELIATATEALNAFDVKAEPLRQIATYIIARKK